MRINTRFTVAVHVLALIELGKHNNIPVTSQTLALSVNTNPVVVRRIISMLKKAKLVSAKAGVAGTYLLRSPKDITWLDIFNAVKTNDDFSVFSKHKNPNKNCPVGAYILDIVKEPLHKAQQAMEKELSAFTLLNTVAAIEQRNNIKL